MRITFFNHCQVAVDMMTFTPKYLVFPKNKDMPLYNHSIMIKIRKLSLLQYYYPIEKCSTNFSN